MPRTAACPTKPASPTRITTWPAPTACSDWQSRAVKVVNWSEVLDVGARKDWLATRGPMVGCMAVYRDFFSYTGGVYRHTSGDLAGYHAIGVVGYSEAEQCWICKNSWGTGWGELGWFKIGYGECGMDTEFAMYGVEAVTPPSPEPPPPPRRHHRHHRRQRLYCLAPQGLPEVLTTQQAQSVQRFSDPAEPIRVRAGETFAIVLAGNPTTGYTWQAETDTPALELLGQQFEAGKGSVGAGGQEVLHFQAQQPGEVTDHLRIRASLGRRGSRHPAVSRRDRGISRLSFGPR